MQHVTLSIKIGHGCETEAARTIDLMPGTNDDFINELDPVTLRVLKLLLEYTLNSIEWTVRAQFSKLT